MALMTKRQYASHYGCTPAYLSKREIKARLESAMVVDPADGFLKIDCDKADKIFQQTRDPSRTPFSKSKIRGGYSGTNRGDTDGATVPASGGQPGVPLYEQSKALREAIKAEEAQLDLLERKGLTVNRAAVFEAAAAAGQAIREYLRAAMRRISEQAATMTDAREIYAMCETELRAATDLASNDFKRRIPDSDGESGGGTAPASH